MRRKENNMIYVFVDFVLAGVNVIIGIATFNTPMHGTFNFAVAGFCVGLGVATLINDLMG